MILNKKIFFIMLFYLLHIHKISLFKLFLIFSSFVLIYVLRYDLYRIMSSNYFSFLGLEIIGLNSIKFNICGVGFTILTVFKIFCLFLMAAIFLYLIYFELKNKNINNSGPYLKAGMIDSAAKRYITLALLGTGGVASYITIKDELIKLGLREDLLSKKEAENLSLRGDLDRINREKSELEVQNNIKAEHIQMTNNILTGHFSNAEKINDSYDLCRGEIKNLEEKIANLEDEQKFRPNIETMKQIQVFRNALAEKQKVIYAIMAKRNVEEKKFKNDIKELEDTLVKSSILPLDDLFEWFLNLDGIQKLALLSVVSNSTILVCIISVIYAIFGNYLLNKFDLENKYPSLAKIINLRLKFQRYYLISNISIIILVCLYQILLNTAILSLFLGLNN